MSIQRPLANPTPQIRVSTTGSPAHADLRPLAALLCALHRQPPVKLVSPSQPTP